MRYFIQFNAGMGELVLSALASDLKRVRVVFQDDSSVIVDSGANPKDVAALSYLKNSFAIAAETGRTSLKGAIPAFVAQLKRQEFARLSPKNRGFRIMTSIDGELVALPRDARSRLESSIVSRTGGWIEARGSGEEYWIIGRRELDVMLLGLRLPKKKAAPVPKGALSAELSEMLVRASKPRPDDVFMDPFGGSGSIILARLSSPSRRVLYSDTDFRSLKREFRPELARAGKVEFLAEDARNLPSVADGAIDVVVTDPPWGEHQELDIPFADFAVSVAASLDRVLRKRSGRFVVLIARREEEVFGQALEKVGFFLSSTHRILVNGHPATVLVGGRSAT